MEWPFCGHFGGSRDSVPLAGGICFHCGHSVRMSFIPGKPQSHSLLCSLPGKVGSPLPLLQVWPREARAPWRSLAPKESCPMHGCPASPPPPIQPCLSSCSLGTVQSAAGPAAQAPTSSWLTAFLLVLSQLSSIPSATQPALLQAPGGHQCPPATLTPPTNTNCDIPPMRSEVAASGPLRGQRVPVPPGSLNAIQGEKWLWLLCCPRGPLCGGV